MSGRHWHPGQTGHADGGGSGDLGGNPLAVGHAGGTNLLAYGVDDTTPAHHGATAQRQRDGDDDPGRCIFGSGRQILAPFGKVSQLFGRQRQLGHLASGIVDTQQQTAHFTAVGQVHLFIGPHLGKTIVQRGHGLQGTIGSTVGHQLFLGLGRHTEVHYLGNLLMVALIDLHDALIGILGAIQVIGAAVHVQCEIGRSHADQHQHHQTDTLLAIVGTVHKAHAHGRRYQSETCPERRMLLAIHQQTLFRGLVDLAALPDAFHGEQQQRGDDETDGGRDDQGKHDVDGFRDVDAFLQRLMADPGIGAAYPQNGADQRV